MYKSDLKETNHNGWTWVAKSEQDTPYRRYKTGPERRGIYVASQGTKWVEVIAEDSIQIPQYRSSAIAKLKKLGYELQLVEMESYFRLR